MVVASLAGGLNVPAGPTETHIAGGLGIAFAVLVVLGY